jgi:Family of unknown function (DUF5682)
MAVHLFGIRHHGPGSARSLLSSLHALKPDAVLIEGPPEAEPLLPLIADEAMKPPVAILIYVTDTPRIATFFPFAVFSPEWQAIQFASGTRIPIRFIDLPQTHDLALAEEKYKTELAAAEKSPEPADSTSEQTPSAPVPAAVREDPLTWLARAAGFSDGESWWEHMVEHRLESGDIFAAITEAMGQLRHELPPQGSEEELLREARREAHMRQCIRTAEKEFKSVAVVCGAWHVPTLRNDSSAKDDAALLKGIPKTKVKATCIPWTHARLQWRSGYRAGVDSPGWYHHLWTVKDKPVIRWMTKVARLLRKEDLDASSAHIIEAVRLAETLAAVRDRPLPSLTELNEASIAVLCLGNDLPMKLIHDKLIVGNQLGSVPPETPTVPLQQDVSNEQRRLRLKPETGSRSLDLDLRNDTDLSRSHLLHRLNLLGIAWGKQEKTQRAKGTFHELWNLAWEPEFEITLIERGAWGNSLIVAAGAYAKHLADQAKELPALTSLIQAVLLAQLPEAASHTIGRLQEEAALSNDVAQLMAALPSLTSVIRYGNVRKSEVSMVVQIVRGFVARICIGLPLACISLDDDAARTMIQHVTEVDRALGILQDEELTREWHQVLHKLASQNALHGLLAGRCIHLLFKASAMSSTETSKHLSLALSPGVDPAFSAAWCEGFLEGSGTLLVHDETMLGLVDEWVSNLSAEHFIQQLAALRRTFATFHGPERRQIGERIARGQARTTSELPGEAFDIARGDRVLPLVAQVLGLSYKPADRGEASE